MLARTILVPPPMIGDVLAIAGDSIDNIPGAGIGRKAAAALLKEHGGLESLLVLAAGGVVLRALLPELCQRLGDIGRHRAVARPTARLKTLRS